MLKKYSFGRGLFIVSRILGFVVLIAGVGMAVIQIVADNPDYILSAIFIGASLNSIIFCYAGEAVIDNADINQRLLMHFNPKDSWFVVGYESQITYKGQVIKCLEDEDMRKRTFIYENEEYEYLDVLKEHIDKIMENR